MPSDETRQLARIAAVTGSLDKLLDEMFAAVAELKVLLAPAGPADGPPGRQAPN